jgi:phage tail tape-measure protein
VEKTTQTTNRESVFENDTDMRRNQNKMNAKTKLLERTRILALAGAMFVTGCAGGSLSTREKGAGIGALGGAAAGGLVGAATGHPGAGAAIGGVLGLGAGALVGDQLQGHEITNYQQQQQIQRNQAEINRNRQSIQRLERQRNEY